MKKPKYSKTPKNVADALLPDINQEPLTEPTEDEKILELAKERLAAAKLAQSFTIREANEDENFIAGDQWDPSVLSERSIAGRPCLTIDIISPEIYKAIGSFQQRRIGMTVKPMDRSSTTDQAELQTSIIKHIEENSKASAIYTRQYENVAIRGYSDFRIVTEYAPKQFYQEIKMVVCRGTVYWDVNSIDEFKTDARHCFITATLSRKVFEEMYPDYAPGALDANQNFAAMAQDQVELTEYFIKKVCTRTLYQFSDYTVLTDEDEDYEEDVKKKADKGIYQIDKRKEEYDCVKWYLLTPLKVLDSRDLKISRIPVIHVPGKVATNQQGKRVEMSLVRKAKDAQRNYNYWRSAATEAVALAPKAPILVEPAMMEGFEYIYNSLHSTNRPYLPYNPVASGKEPHRLDNGIIPQGEALMAQTAKSDVQACLGVSDLPSQARTGDGVMAMTAPQDDGQFWITGNLIMSLEEAGRILLEMIPIVYDTERSIKVSTPDSPDKYVVINKDDGEGNVYNKITEGNYNVIVDIEANSRTTRQLAQKAMMFLLQTQPQEAIKAMDLIAESMDFPGASDLASRFRKYMPAAVAPPQSADEAKAQQLMAQQQQQGSQAAAKQMLIQTQQQAIEKQKLQLQEAQMVQEGKLKTQQLMSDHFLKQKELDLKTGTANVNAAAKDKDLNIKDFKAMSDHIKNMTPPTETIDVVKKSEKD